MTKKYKILGKFISDMSSETKDIETYIFWVEIKNKSSLINSINNLKKISTSGLNISMYTNDNIHE